MGKKGEELKVERRYEELGCWEGAIRKKTGRLYVRLTNAQYMCSYLRLDFFL